jgi:hypothetical protein
VADAAPTVIAAAVARQPNFEDPVGLPPLQQAASDEAGSGDPEPARSFFLTGGGADLGDDEDKGERSSCDGDGGERSSCDGDEGERSSCDRDDVSGGSECKSACSQNDQALVDAAGGDSEMRIVDRELGRKQLTIEAAGVSQRCVEKSRERQVGIGDGDYDYMHLPPFTTEASAAVCIVQSFLLYCIGCVFPANGRCLKLVLFLVASTHVCSFPHPAPAPV